MIIDAIDAADANVKVNNIVTADSRTWIERRLVDPDLWKIAHKQWELHSAV